MDNKIPYGGVYIGRTSKKLNLEGSIFANPFPMKDQTIQERERVISEYQKWLWIQISENKITKEDLLNLKEKKLICYCAPKVCHGDILKEVVELLIHDEEKFNQKMQAVVQNKEKTAPIFILC